MIAWVFPGQGSQFVGMGAGLESPGAREAFEIAREVLGWDVRSVCVHGPEEMLGATDFSQPAILTVSVAAARALEARGQFPDLVAGHSVGEFAALVASQSIGFEDALRVVAARAEAMAAASRATPGRMAAVIGLPPETVAALCDPGVGIVRVATINTADQVVISGEIAAVAAVADAAKQAGARRVIPLAVSVPAHSPLMATARKRVFDNLSNVSVLPPLVPFVSCVSGEVEQDPGTIIRSLSAGLTQTVNWPASVQRLREVGAESFVEVGPGTVLSGLLRRIAADSPIAAVASDEDADGLVEQLTRVG